VLALEAERTILIDRGDVLASADRAGIAILGVSEASLRERSS
jgi:DUF1009 family protein